MMKNAALMLALAGWLAAVSSGGAGGGPAATTAPAIGLERDYTDTYRGFSLRVPAEAERVRISSPRRLVNWVWRDAKTGAIRWNLQVLRTRQKPTTLPAADYAKAVARELRRNRFRTDSVRTGKLAGRPAMHFSGIWTSKTAEGKALRLWRRQTWVTIRPQVNLILDIHGPVSDRERLDAMLTAVAGSLRLFDPKVTLVQRTRGLKRAAVMLAGLNDAKLRAVLAPKRSYFTVAVKGRTIGFLRVDESMASRSGSTGVRAVRGGSFRPVGKTRQLIREDMFSTANRQIERWRRVETDPGGRRRVTEAVKQQDVLVIKVPGRKALQRKLSPAHQDAYLPQAFGLLLPRLIDRTGPGTYCFAIYNVSEGDFDIRTVRVIGQEWITLGEREVRATHLTDQMAPDAPTADVWVDGKGLLLRMKSAGEVVIERVDRGTVLRLFTRDVADLDRLRP